MSRPRQRSADDEDERDGATLVYGRNPVREALRGPRRVDTVWATQAAIDGEQWLRDLPGSFLRVVEGWDIGHRVGADGHQGVCADVEPYRYVDAAALLERSDPWIVALDELTDPQNLGAIIRTAEVAGVTGLVIPERRAAEVTGAVCKASAGAVEHLPVAKVRNLADFLADAKKAGCWCYGAAAEAEQSYRQPDYSGGAVLVLGAEGKGLRPRVADSCDVLVSLPQRGQVESLNVSAAAAVLMYEMLQQRLDTST